MPSAAQMFFRAGTQVVVHRDAGPTLRVKSQMTTQVQIFCVKCKEKTDSSDVQSVTMKNGRPATQAICAVCGTRKFRIGALPVA